MRKTTLLLLVAALATGTVFAQKQKKPNINKALKMMQAGDLANAQIEIDRASTNEKLQGNGKTWYYRGLIYASIDTSATISVDNALQTAVESFAKADELEEDGNLYYISDANGFPVTKPQQVDALWGIYINEGVEAYQDGNNEAAIVAFEKSSILSPQDTTGYLYAGLASQNAKNYDNALKNFKKYFEVGGEGEDVYGSMIYIVGTEQKDNEGALELVKKAKEVFPTNTSFPKQEIDILRQLGRIDEAILSLENAVKVEPTNKLLLNQLAGMYDGNKEYDKAAVMYKKSLEVDENDLVANFNIAVIYYNEAAIYINKKNALGISNADQKKATELGAVIDGKLKDSLPFWLKAHSLDSTDVNVISSIADIYERLKQSDKVEEYTKKLDAIEEGE